MESLFHTLASSPLLMVIAALLLFVLLLSAVLRLAKLALVVTFLLVVYVGYLHLSGGEVPGVVRQAESSLHEVARDTGKVLKENASAAGRAVQVAAQEAGEKLQSMSPPAAARAHPARSGDVPDVLTGPDAAPAPATSSSVPAE